jgi:simple sugar transport system substrate-binding protein/basic membrane protein A
MAKFVAVIGAVALLAAACSKGSGSGAGGSASTSSGPVKVALILPGYINDLSFNQMSYQGAKELEQQGLIRLAYTEAVPEDAASLTPVVERYVAAGYQLILADSFGYGTTIFSLAKKYPNVDFVYAGGIGKTTKNVGDFEQPVYQAAYLAGILAAGFTKSKVLGGIGAFDIPPCHSQLQAFVLGAQSVDPSIKQISSYSGDWVDVQKNQQAAQAEANQGADVFVPCGEGPALGAINVAKAHSLYAIGNVGDMSPLAPQNVFASEVMNFYYIWKPMVEDVTNGTFQPAKYYPVSFKAKSLAVALNSELTSKLPASVMSAYQSAVDKVESGTLKVPFVAK